MQLRFSEALSHVFLHFRRSPEDACCYSFTDRVGEDSCIETDLQKGALWKAIIFHVHHAFLRASSPARRKEANDEMSHVCERFSQIPRGGAPFFSYVVQFLSLLCLHKHITTDLRASQGCIQCYETLLLRFMGNTLWTCSGEEVQQAQVRI